MRKLQIIAVVAVSAIAAIAAARFPTLRIRTGPGNDPTLTRYGAPQKVGKGTVRTYITVNADDRGVPVEIGVALSESAMESLPTAAAMRMDHSMDGGATMNMGTMLMSAWLLDLPKKNPTPYKFVQFDWNPEGHEPEGVYNVPHFDFHFYTVPVSVRNEIVPMNPQFAAKAAAFPDSAYRAPFYLDASTAAKIPATAATVPQMGLHWLDVRSPELQGLAGHPENAKPFTKTFIYGSWDGKFIFDEPMITKAYLQSVSDETIAVPTAGRYSPAGFRPAAYRITHDVKAHEYRVALTQLALRK